MREQHPAHLWIFVLTLVNDGLQNDNIKNISYYKRLNVFSLKVSIMFEVSKNLNKKKFYKRPNYDS